MPLLQVVRFRIQIEVDPTASTESEADLNLTFVQIFTIPPPNLAKENNSEAAFLTEQQSPPPNEVGNYRQFIVVSFLGLL